MLILESYSAFLSLEVKSIANFWGEGIIRPRLLLCHWQLWGPLWESAVLPCTHTNTNGEGIRKSLTWVTVRSWVYWVSKGYNYSRRP